MNVHDAGTLAAQFNEAVHHAGAFVAHLAEVTAAHILAGLIAGAVSATVLHRLQARKTRKAIMDGNFENDHAVFTDTNYYPSGQINPETGQEYVKQVIRTLTPAHIELERIFPPPQSIMLMESIMAASKHCTEENPVVFAHLDKVIKDPKELERVQGVIARKWVSFFSDTLGGNLERAMSNHGERDEPEESGFLPVLTLERYAGSETFRIMLFRLDDIKAGRLPDAKNVLVEVRDNEFVREEDYNLMQRLDTNRAIHRVLNAPEGQWIKDFTSVRKPTGKYHKVKAPVMGGTAPA